MSLDSYEEWRLIEKIKLEPFALRKLLNTLSNKTGIDFGYYRSNFVEKRIKSRMIRLNLYDAPSYLKYLSSNPSEIDLFFKGFTINTSYLFRNREVFDRLEMIINACLKNSPTVGNNSKRPALPRSVTTRKIFNHLPQLSIYKKFNNGSTSPRLNIWSCACASGEEPYSLAILFNNLKKNVLNFPSYKIIASDIDRHVLERAKLGEYSEEVMKEVSAIDRHKYFTKVKARFGIKYALCNTIKNQVDFVEEDVTKGHPKSQYCDIIFCRYFLIYTDRAARDKILRTLEESLAYGGILILGKTETLFNSHHHLKLIDTRNHIYVKVKYN